MGRSLDERAMENWRYVWRKGIAPVLSNKHLEVLRQALVDDDPRLIRGTTVKPTLSYSVFTQEFVEGACALGYCGWQGDGLKTIGEVTRFFAQLCGQINQTLGETAICGEWLDWFDNDHITRDQMRQELLTEVLHEMSKRQDQL